MAELKDFNGKSGVASVIKRNLEASDITVNVVELQSGSPALEVEFTSVMQSNVSIDNVYNLMARKGFYKREERMSGKYVRFGTGDH